jgi:hypothetical protein
VETDLRFDRDRLRAELRSLSPKSRAVFAALCARRLASSRVSTGEVPSEGEGNVFANLHAELWSSLIGQPRSKRELKAASGRALALLPAEEGDQPFADDAAAALVYAFRTAVGGEPQDAAWAAERIYNALDTFLQVQSYDLGAPGGEDALRQHPLVQAELRRQSADLEALGEMERHRLAGGALEDLRERADAAAAHVFG